MILSCHLMPLRLKPNAPLMLQREVSVGRSPKGAVSLGSASGINSLRPEPNVGGLSKCQA